MNIDLKYSSQELDEPLPFNILETRFKKNQIKFIKLIILILY